MTSYFIAMNRSTGKSAEENYILFRDGLCASKLFHKVIGDVEQYLDPKNAGKIAMVCGQSQAEI